MQSWSLKKFIDEHGIDSLRTIWGVSRQAIDQALTNKRSIRITLIDGVYEVMESKVLQRTRVKS